MKIEVDAEVLAALWNAARRGTDRDGDDHAEGAYDMIQALTGNADPEELIQRLRNGETY